MRTVRNGEEKSFDDMGQKTPSDVTVEVVARTALLAAIGRWFVAGRSQPVAWHKGEPYAFTTIAQAGLLDKIGGCRFFQSMQRLEMKMADTSASNLAPTPFFFPSGVASQSAVYCPH